MPVVLALVLGPPLETNFRRAVVEAQGDYTALLTQPISLLFLLLSLASALAPLWNRVRARLK